MSSRSLQTQRSTSSAPVSEPNRKGSVARAREQLEAGMRPSRTASPGQRPSPGRQDSPQTQWPLPASGLQPRLIQSNQHPGFRDPRGPPPRRPPRPSEVPSQVPSPSVYSARTDRDSEANYANRPARSFSHPEPPQLPMSRPYPNDESCPSPTSKVDMATGVSITTDELFRDSKISTTSSVSGVPPVPSKAPPQAAREPWQHTAGILPPSRVRHPQGCNSAVSPIPESREPLDPRRALGSFASSRVIPSSWGPGPAQSDILEAYLDIDSDSDEHEHHEDHDGSGALVRHASIGKREKPTMRTFAKHTATSEAPVPEKSSSHPKEESGQEKATATGALGVEVADPESNTPLSTRTVSTASSESCIDPEKPRFAQLAQTVSNEALQKEIESLTQAAPAMSENRPGARRPPRLDINAVRVAETRGSLSSLSDLIRRATKLASNLDRGRTASRADLAADEDSNNAHEPGRIRSGNLSDMLASFPNPGPATSDNRGSWPVFLSRPTPRNAESLRSNDDDAKRVQRKCCGIPRKWFILLCILLFILIVLAILLPVFLVAVPMQNISNAPSCSETKPCQNGGVSVSSGVQCSCVCSNGYTGSQCTIAGDSSCVTSEVENRTMAKNATMGSSLPRLFHESHSKLGIKLDSITIMALFSKNNVSCKMENALVAFSDVKRSRPRSIDQLLDADRDTGNSDLPSQSQSLDSTATGAALAARATATSNGIVYYNSPSNQGSDPQGASTPTPSTSIPPTKQTNSGSGATTETNPASSSNSSTTMPDAVVEFSQVAVLYILQKTGSLDSALSSESQISSFLLDSYGSVMHPRLELFGTFGLDFENRMITIRTRSGTLSA